MRTVGLLIATMFLLGACSFQDIPIIQDLLPSEGDGEVDHGDDPGDGGDVDVTQPPMASQVDLVYGDSVAETLGSGRGDLWTFSGDSGDVVTITMISGEFDTFLALFGPTGNYLTCDDDSGGDFNASIIDFPLPASGDYAINTMSLAPDRVGAYSLSISQTANGMVHPQAGGGSLSIGDAKLETIAAWIGDAWTFSGTAGEVISVGARSEDFDTVLSIYGPDLSRVAWDDDSLGNYNSLISGLTLHSSGRYTIVVRAYSDAAIGAYELGSATGVEIPGWEAASPDNVNIMYGETVQSDLAGVQGDQWVFSGTAGDHVLVSVISEEFDSMLSLFGPNGEYLTFDDDSGGGANAMLDGYTLPASGLYYIGVLSYGTGATGAYTLTLEQTSAGAIPSCTNSAAISYGASVNQVLGAWVGDEWMFEGTAGDIITINMTSTDFDTSLELYGPNLLRVAMDDDSGGETNSQISSVMLPLSGIYSIVARALGPGQAGEYTLSLTN